MLASFLRACELEPVKSFHRILAVLLPLAAPSSAGAWGYEGHRIVALVARSYVAPSTRAKVDALLSMDPDLLTGHDMASEATWADVYRSHGHRETSEWHFVDQELDGSADLDTACYGHPASAVPASSGPGQSCVVDRVRAFEAELAAPGTSLAERVLALKYLLHLVGDLHQPLHASDNHDRGGNCVLVSLGGSRAVSLHSYWDTVVVEGLDRDPARLAATLRTRIRPAQASAWRQGDAATWAQEAFRLSRVAVYVVGSTPGCRSDAAALPLPPGYEERAAAAAALQLARAGVRLAAVLDRALSSVPVPAAVSSPAIRSAGPSAAPSAGAIGGTTRTAESLACSSEADARDLHGDERRRFRRRCISARRVGH